jgi:hypothetical protein
MGSQFDLEYQYSLYLQRMGLNEQTMREDQKRETKRAFIGACGQMLILLRDELPLIPEEEGIEAMQNMINEVAVFFMNETGKQN